MIKLVPKSGLEPVKKTEEKPEEKPKRKSKQSLSRSKKR